MNAIVSSHKMHTGRGVGSIGGRSKGHLKSAVATDGGRAQDQAAIPPEGCRSARDGEHAGGYNRGGIPSHPLRWAQVQAGLRGGRGTRSLAGGLPREGQAKRGHEQAEEGQDAYHAEEPVPESVLFHCSILV